MSVVVDYEPLIQATLVEAAETAPFPFVSYHEGRMVVSQEQFGQPDSIMAKAESSLFSPSRDRRTRRYDRTEWNWLLELTFKGEVALGQFERRLLESPPRILRDRAAGRDQQVTLILTGSVYQSPPEGQPAGGTRASFRFNAELTPS